MLPKNRRLIFKKKLSEFTRAKKTNNIYFTLLVEKQNKTPLTKFAIVASLKFSKKAVVRNRIKRQLRSAIKELLNQINEGFNVIILVKKQAMDTSYKQLSESLENTFQRSGLIK